jgi:hypothetical protein
MKTNPQHILDACLEAMRAGQSLEQALRSYPELAAELRPLLQLAAELTALPEPAPAMHGLMRALAQAALAEPRGSQAPQPLRVRFWSLPVLARVAASLVAAFLLFWGLTAASSQAVPGNLLYPIKRLTERMHVFLTLNSSDQAELRLVFSERRLAEAIKKHQREGGIDEQLLRAMLDEAKSALDRSANLPPEQRGCLISRVDHLTAHQQTVIAHLQHQAPPPVQNSIAPFADMCSRRMQWMDEMMAQMGMPAHGSRAAATGPTQNLAPAASSSPGESANTNQSNPSRPSMGGMMHMQMRMRGPNPPPTAGTEKPETLFPSSPGGNTETNSLPPSPTSMKEWMQRCPMWQK